MIPAISILDLCRVTQESDARTALDNARDLAAHAENWGYTRFWLAEHHNMPGIASAATSLVIQHVAAGTKTIRVGAGGIMLPNHAPIVVAEQFGTLARLFPGRIDLGLGRAPGTDQIAVQALRRSSTTPTIFRATSSRSRPISRRCSPLAVAGGACCRRRCADLDPRLVNLRRSWRRSSACPTPLPRTSRPTCCCRRCSSTARGSSRPNSCSSPMR